MNALVKDIWFFDVQLYRRASVIHVTDIRYHILHVSDGSNRKIELSYAI